ncbi:lamin tail domain-containing metallophosphoesterase family protein [Glycomyces tarimensis]
MPTTAIAATLALVLSVLTVSSSAAAQIGPKVLISELSNYGAAGSADEVIELTNYGDETADLSGWQVYRCAASGSRSYDPQIPPLGSVTLDPGETFLLANAGGTVTDADAYYEVSVANAGFGVWLEDANRNRVDSVAVYADPVDSECALGDEPLPNDLNGIRNQSWQRVDDSGTDADDFIKAVRTPGEPNATEPDDGVQPSDVLVSELTNAGPGGSSDDFVEFANFGDDPVDVGGWGFYRCWGAGQTTPGSLQATIPAGTVLAPGEVFVAAHNSVSVPAGVAHARYSTSLANVGFGAMLIDDEGGIRDAVGVYETDGVHQPPTGSACIQGEALPNRLDFGWNQTWQRTGDTGDNADDFVRAERTIGELAAPDHDPGPAPVDSGIRVSELVNAGPNGGADEFFELANFGDEPADLSGWQVYRCQEDGRRNPTLQIPVIGDVVLEPGETYLSVHTGSGYHDRDDWDASYDVGLAAGGFGLMVLDDRGRLADSVGVYNASYSPCTQGLSLFNAVAFEDGETFQRLDETAYNADDFVTAERSPGSLPDDLRHPTDFTDAELEPVEVDPAGRPLAPETGAEVEGRTAALSATADHTTGGASDLAFTGAPTIAVNERASRVYTGATDQAPPSSRRVDGEDEADLGVLEGGGELVTESTASFPFQRYELNLGATQREDFQFTWSGASTGTNELQMYAWNHRSGQWDLIAADGGMTGGQITLTGAVEASNHLRGRNVDILVQDGPATAAAFSDDAAEPNLAFKDPAEYDVSFGYVTDTQFLSEGYRESYAEMTRWIATNADARGIEYTAHTGDLIQNWLNGTHSSERAVDEYEFASDTMAVLERAGQPYGVTPGNHDNKWGREGELYNEHFPAERFEDEDWYGGAWRPDDSQNHYDVIEADGAEFLFLYLGYFAGEDAIDWANQVLGAHPDHNVVFATHEYLHPDGSLSTPDNYRWTSMADRYWNEIVLPNENVFMVLAGHHHGVALNIKRDVGGVDGRVVVEMMANYQGFEDEGRFNAGFMRLLQVDVDAGLMAVNTYSPLREEHNAWEYKPDDVVEEYDDATDEFTIEVDLNTGYDKRIATELIAPHTAAVEIGTAGAADGETATVDWTGLAWCGDYLWIANAAADGRTARSAAAIVSTTGRGGRECD